MQIGLFVDGLNFPITFLTEIIWYLLFLDKLSKTLLEAVMIFDLQHQTVGSLDFLYFIQTVCALKLSQCLGT